MLNYRIKTFLELCRTMNYTKTAENLNMTQPAVTQQIHYLENLYQCKLFDYTGKKLRKTEKCLLLERYAQSMAHNENLVSEFMTAQNYNPKTLHIGATKTIGEYVIGEKIISYLADDRKKLSLTVDNTNFLLKKLETGELDFALIEGNFDKDKYEYRLLQREPFIGICQKGHSFAKKTIPFQKLVQECIIVREEGSGTRNILEQLLYANNYSLNSFKKSVCISNFSVIKQLVASGIGVSLVFSAVRQKEDDLDVFYLENSPEYYEFNCVFLKNTIEWTEILAFCQV